MIGEFLDRLIGVFAPRMAVNRAWAREEMRAFDAISGELKRHQARPNPKSLGPITETQQSRAELLLRARDLDRNNGWAKGVFTSIVDNIVGEGIFPEVRIRGPRGALKQNLNDQLEGEWERWSEKCDPRGQQSIYELQAQVERDLWVAGEVLVLFSNLDPGKRPIPLAIELVDSERLASIDEERTARRTEIRQGIETNDSGEIVAYHIYDDHPGDGRGLEPKRIPAERMLHVFHPNRIGSIRGLSRLHPVSNTFGALAQYLDYELTRARVGASWALMVKRHQRGMAFPVVSGADTEDSSGNKIARMHGGMIFQGGPNDSLEGTGPAFPNAAFEPFVVLMLRMVSAGLNISYEVLTRDFSRTNFSSSRSAALEDRKHWRPRQGFLIRHFANPVYRRWLEVAGISKLDQLRGIDTGAVPIKWRVPGWDWVDPVKEVKAEEQATANAFTSPQEVCATHGRDFYSIVDQIAEAKQYAEERGVELAFTKAGTNGITNEDQEDPEAKPGREAFIQAPTA